MMAQLRPSEEVNQTIGGIVARYARIHEMPIVFWVVPSNHEHGLLIPNDADHLAAFMRDVQSQIAKEIGLLLEWEQRFWGRRCKDLALLRAIADPFLLVSGFSNKNLRQLLADDSRFAGKTNKQRSGMITRSLRLLRDHGVLRRLPRSRRYQVTLAGHKLVTALQAALSASVEQLTEIAA